MAIKDDQIRNCPCQKDSSRFFPVEIFNIENDSLRQFTLKDKNNILCIHCMVGEIFQLFEINKYTLIAIKVSSILLQFSNNFISKHNLFGAMNIFRSGDGVISIQNSPHQNRTRLFAKSALMPNLNSHCAYAFHKKQNC